MSKPSEAATKLLSVRTDAKLRKKLDAIAKAQHRTTSNLVRIIIAEYVGKEG